MVNNIEITTLMHIVIKDSIANCHADMVEELATSIRNYRSLGQFFKRKEAELNST